MAIAPVLGLPPGTLTGVPNQPRGVIEVQGAIETDDYDDIEIIDLEQPDPAPVRTTGARVLDARVDALLRQGDAARDAGRLAEAQQRYLMASLVDPDRPGLDRRLAEVQAAIDRVRIDSTKKRTKKKKKRRRRPKRSKRSSGPYVIVD